MIEIRTILVPMDFSSHSERALLFARHLADKHGAKLHLLHCYGIDMIAAVPYDHYVPSIPEDFEASVRDAARKKLESYCEQVRNGGIQVECHLSKLSPTEAIGRKAEQFGADMIVMGTHGLRGLRHVLLGSVAERTIRQATCPVLTVRAEKTESTAT